VVFVISEQWQAASIAPLPRYRPLLVATQKSQSLAWTEELVLRWRLERPALLLLAIATAVALFAGLANLTQMTLPKVMDRMPMVLELIELEEPKSDASAGSAAAPAKSVAQANIPPSPNETSTPTPIAPPEWRVSRIARIGPVRLGENSSNGSLGIGSGGSASGAGGGAMGVYDPYAGAAPRWRPSAETRADGLDERQLQAAITQVKQRYPNAQGMVDLQLRLSPGGMVMDVSFLSPITPVMASAVRTALMGKPLGANIANQISVMTSEPVVRLAFSG
jgi:hypothetical protein